MKNSINNQVNNSANVVSKSETTVKTQRVLEDRKMWTIIHDHAVALVAALAKGEPLCENARKGFAFGNTTNCPHCRAYAKSLLVGFTSRKAGKVLADIEELSDENRTKIAIAILVGTKLEPTPEKAKSYLGKGEPKQAKSFATAVLNAIQNETKTEEAALSEQELAEELAEQAENEVALKLLAEELAEQGVSLEELSKKSALSEQDFIELASEMSASEIAEYAEELAKQAEEPKAKPTSKRGGKRGGTSKRGGKRGGTQKAASK